MKPLAAHLATDARLQRSTSARLVLLVVAPMGVWFLLAALAPLHLVTVAGLGFTLAHAATLALLVWYLRMDTPLGIACTVLFTVLLVAALEATAGEGAVRIVAWAGLAWSVALFALAWTVWMRPAGRPSDAVGTFLLSPMLLVTRLAFLLGMRMGLKRDAERVAGASGSVDDP